MRHLTETNEIGRNFGRDYIYWFYENKKKSLLEHFILKFQNICLCAYKTFNNQARYSNEKIPQNYNRV